MKAMFKKINTSIIKFGQIFLWLVSKLITKVIFQTKVQKTIIEKTDRPTIMLSNHVSLFDAFIFVGSLSWSEFRSISPLRAMLAKWYYHSLLFPVVYLIGCYPARPLIPAWKKYSGTSGTVRHANSGGSVGLYPEGARSQHGRIKAKYGVVKILGQLDNPTVYLCKIERKSTRNFEVIIDRVDKVSALKDPDKIMDEVYKLK